MNHDHSQRHASRNWATRRYRDLMSALRTEVAEAGITDPQLIEELVTKRLSDRGLEANAQIKEALTQSILTDSDRPVRSMVIGAFKGYFGNLWEIYKDMKGHAIPRYLEPPPTAAPPDWGGPDPDDDSDFEYWAVPVILANDDEANRMLDKIAKEVPFEIATEAEVAAGTTHRVFEVWIRLNESAPDGRPCDIMAGKVAIGEFEPDDFKRISPDLEMASRNGSTLLAECWVTGQQRSDVKLSVILPYLWSKR